MNIADNERLALGVSHSLEAMHLEAKAIELATSHVAAHLPAAISLLWSAQERIVISGLGKSGHIGAKIAASMASTGTPSFFVHATEALHGDSGMVTPRDVTVLISYSGETAEVCHFARMLKARSIPIIAMTRSADSTLASLSDVWLSIEVEHEADPLNLAPTSSTAVTLAIGDALAAGLMAMRNFTAEEFAVFHPGGSLGKSLMTNALSASTSQEASS